MKDFSRFARNAIEAGYFIERVFPLYHVRLISISDGFDSAEHEGDTGGMEVAFKLLMHEYYSQDLSRKIRTAKQEKARRGEFVTRNCAFGYRLDDQRNMVIDPEAAETVRMIFHLYAEGNSIAEIQNQLCKQHRPTPKVWKHHQVAQNRPEELRCVWEKSVIQCILKNEQYTGTYVAGKTQTVDVSNDLRKRNDPSNWIRIPGHHPAVVSQELFNRIQERFAERKRSPSKLRKTAQSQSFLKGKVQCAYCKHIMQLIRTKNAAFHCKFTLPVPGAACHRLRISSTELESRVYEHMRQQARCILDEQNGRNDANSLVHQMDELRREKQQLYECLVLGEIASEEYRAQKILIDTEEERVQQAMSLPAEKQESASHTTLLQAVQAALQSDALTQELVDMLIDRVLVYPDGKIDICWKIAAFEEVQVQKQVEFP